MTNRSGGRVYDFDVDSDHKAYWIQTPIFLTVTNLFSPDSPFITKHLFDGRNINNIKYPNDGRYASKSTAFGSPFVIHEFKFDVDVDADSIGKIIVNWKGKIEDAKFVKLYAWKYYGDDKKRSFWQILESDTNNDEVIDFSHLVSKTDSELLLHDGYIYINVVVRSSSILTKAIIHTDYVNITSLDETGYFTGTATATVKNPISPKDISGDSDLDFYWDILTWEDYKRDGSTIKYHVLYNNSGNWTLVEDKYFNGDVSNNDGFTSSPVYLNDVPYDKIKISATLETDSPSITPKIYSWTVTWQSNSDRWQDKFSSTYRIDVKRRVNVNDYVNISPAQGEWPMFGFNSENIRATEGDGALTSDLYWYGVESEEYLLTNPVIGDGSLYIADSNRHLLRYSLEVTDNPGEEHSKSGDFGPISYDFIGSPLISDDYIIVATGLKSPNGQENKIIGYDKNLYNDKWSFLYNKDICYFASPVLFEDKLFVTSCNSGTSLNPGDKNYKVLALDLGVDLESKDDPWTNEDDILLWEFELPTGSVTPVAVYNNMVFAGCKDSDNDTFYALNMEDGSKIWSKYLGEFGSAAPVVYEDKVFVTVKQYIGISKTRAETKIIALDVNDGKYLWNQTVSGSILAQNDIAESTPAAYNDVLYVASPEGKVYALSTENGTILWQYQVYSRGISGSILTSSPAYADSIVYVGTPDGYLYALDTENSGEELWRFETFESIGGANPSPVFSSPIVSNGIVFISDQSGILYAIGSFKESDEQISGHIISIPIKHPTGAWWQKFYADFSVSGNSDINKITFSLLDADKNHIKSLTNGSSIQTGNESIPDLIRLRADFWAKNVSVNPKLFSWYVTYEIDTIPPDFVESSFIPNPGGWMNELAPVLSIEVWDNQTGLNLKTANYTLHYKKLNDSTVYEKIGTPVYSGSDGTNFTLLEIDISSLNISDNLSSLVDLTLTISDLAGNKATFPASPPLVFKQDTEKPTSSIDKSKIKAKYNSSYVKINATATDPGISGVNSSGILKIELYYRYSTNNQSWSDWKFFDDSDGSSASWNFTYQDNGGYFEFMTIATDNADNVEDEKQEGEINFIYDKKAPNPPDYTDTKTWYNELPEITIEFTDDFKLDKIQYKADIEPIWANIATNINKNKYDQAWELSQDIWDQMEEGEPYYLYFKVIDTLGNTYTTSDSKKLEIRKDVTTPRVNLKFKGLGTTEWSFNDVFNITADVNDFNGSGIKSVKFEYVYSSENKSVNESDWKVIDTLFSGPFESNFKASDGDGYYKFRVIVEDFAGNIAVSDVFSTGFNMFPLALIGAMVALFIVLIIVVLFVIIKFKKKEEK